MRIWTLTLVAALAATSVRAETFVCEFNKRHVLQGNDFAALKIENQEKPASFAFSAPDDSCGKRTEYKNLTGNWSGMVHVNCGAGRTTFTEWSTSDNLFIVTVYRGKVGGKYPAVYTLHAWIPGVDFFRPQIATGFCK